MRISDKQLHELQHFVNTYLTRKGLAVAIKEHANNLVSITIRDDELFVELDHDISAAAAIRIMVALAYFQPNEITRVTPFLLRLWWD